LSHLESSLLAGAEGAARGVSGAAGNGDRAGRTDYPEGKAAAGAGRRDRAKGSRLHHLP